MRVIAGQARGRSLQAPRGRTARPTSDRVREAMFSSLADDIDEAVVLDLFAGTGALGIEALSRGAAAATFVERDAQVVQTLRANLASTGLGGRAEVLRMQAATFVDRAPSSPYTVVLCDPPYDEPLAGVLALVGRLDEAGGVAHPAVVVVERDKRDRGVAALRDGEQVPAWVPPMLALDRQRSYGDTVLLYFRSTKDV